MMPLKKRLYAANVPFPNARRPENPPAIRAPGRIERLDRRLHPCQAAG
ncbi:hypothetical protein PQR34_47600 [Paraburkholderia sediminicola]